MEGTVIVNGRRWEDIPPDEQGALKAKWAKRAAEMLASRTPPRGRTDATFLEGHCNGNQFERDPHVGDYYREVAEAAGVSTTGKKYLNALAAFPGDPRAWVDGRGDVQRVCEERGWECEGAVAVKGREFDHAPGPAVAEDIVREDVAEVLRQDPTADPQEVREKVVETRKPHWAKGGTQ